MLGKGLKASELIKILGEKIEKHGDLEVSVDTREGSSYFLENADEIEVITWHEKDGSMHKTIEIG